MKTNVLGERECTTLAHGCFGRFIITATTPFSRDDAAGLRRDAHAVLDRYAPGWRDVYAALDWRMPTSITRVYDNARARAQLGWAPKHDFASVLARARDRQGDIRSELARAIGLKGYHS